MTIYLRPDNSVAIITFGPSLIWIARCNSFLAPIILPTCIFLRVMVIFRFTPNHKAHAVSYVLTKHSRPRGCSRPKKLHIAILSNYFQSLIENVMWHLAVQWIAIQCVSGKHEGLDWIFQPSRTGLKHPAITTLPVIFHLWRAKSVSLCKNMWLLLPRHQMVRSNNMKGLIFNELNQCIRACKGDHT